MSRLDPSEEIGRAFDYGAKTKQDKSFPFPPADWPEEAKREFFDGFSYAEYRLELYWGKPK